MAFSSQGKLLGSSPRTPDKLKQREFKSRNLVSTKELNRWLSPRYAENLKEFHTTRHRLKRSLRSQTTEVRRRKAAKVLKALDRERRLAKATTNQKRAFTTSDLQLFHDFQAVFNPGPPQPAESLLTERSSTEDPSEASCARERLQDFAIVEPPPRPEHEARTMPGSSPGKRKHHSSDPAPPTTKTLLSPEGDIQLAVSSVTEYSADEEHEGRTISAKRVKRSKSHNSEKPIDLTNDQSDIIPNDNAEKDRQCQNSSISKPARETWHAASRYNDPKSNSTPDYGKPRNVPSSRVSLKGPKPVNRLGASAATPSFNGASNRPFNLRGETVSENNNNKSNRSGTARLSGSSSSQDLASSRSSTAQARSNEMLPPPSKSGVSALESRCQYPEAQEPKGTVPEFRHVQDTTTPRNSRKQRNQGLTGSAQRMPPRSFKHADTELSDDPIESDIIEHEPIRRSYTGTSFREPARELKELQRRRDSSVLAMGSRPVSNHSGRGNPRVNNAARANMGAKISVERASKDSEGDQDSIDELSIEHHTRVKKDYAQAHKLLSQPQQDVLANSKAAAQVTKAKNTAELSIDSSSEDESRTRGDITQTKFSSTRVNQRTSNPGEATFDIMRFFSKQQNWLTNVVKAPWKLVYGQDTMTICRDDDRYIWELHAGRVVKIEYNPESPNLIIHKHRDMAVNGVGPMVFLELRTADQCEELRKCLSESSHSALAMITKHCSYLEKCFSSNMDISRKAVQQKPDDIRLLEKNQERQSQLGTRGTTLRDHVSATGVRDNLRNSRNQPNSNTISRRLISRSAMSASEEHRRANRQEEVKPGAFYGSASDIQTNPASSTRSSTRAASFLVRRAERSPSPEERWSERHPEWRSKFTKPLVYPRTGKDKTTVEPSDIPKLDEGQFLNDTIIAFYLLLLQQRLVANNPTLAKRICFLNSFFFTNLTVKGFKKGFFYEAVQRWTAKYDIFKYDYIIVPVNESTHWYVAIICNPSKLLPTQSSPLISPTSAESAFPREAAVDNQKILSYSARTSTLSSGHQSPSTVTTANIDGDGMSLDEKLSRSLIMEDHHSTLNEQSDWPDPDPQPLPVNGKVVSPKRDSQLNGVKEEHDDVDLIISDLQSENVKRPGSGRKPKRKSIVRKHDPNDFRIITLDSLGLAHSPTSTALKQYLVAEAKDKKHLDIPLPGAVGMHPKGIPLQSNHTDCGLFLLSYIEMFLEKGDEFINGLLQNSEDLELQWREPSEMRSSIRDLLFKYQKQQNEEDIQIKQAKVEAKLAAKKATSTGNAGPSKSPSLSERSGESRENGTRKGSEPVAPTPSEFAHSETNGISAQTADTLDLTFTHTESSINRSPLPRSLTKDVSDIKNQQNTTDVSNPRTVDSNRSNSISAAAPKVVDSPHLGSSSKQKYYQPAVDISQLDEPGYDDEPSLNIVKMSKLLANSSSGRDRRNKTVSPEFHNLRSSSHKATQSPRSSRFFASDRSGGQMASSHDITTGPTSETPSNHRRRRGTPISDGVRLSTQGKSQTPNAVIELVSDDEEASAPVGFTRQAHKSRASDDDEMILDNGSLSRKVNGTSNVPFPAQIDASDAAIVGRKGTRQKPQHIKFDN